jgi:hypothetical protein
MRRTSSQSASRTNASSNAVDAVRAGAAAVVVLNAAQTALALAYHTRVRQREKKELPQLRRCVKHTLHAPRHAVCLHSYQGACLQFGTGRVVGRPAVLDPLAGYCDKAYCHPSTLNERGFSRAARIRRARTDGAARVVCSLLRSASTRACAAAVGGASSAAAASPLPPLGP